MNREKKTGIVGGCGKHPGQHFIDCPLCATEPKRVPKSLQDLAIEYNISGEELIMCSNYIVAMRMTKKGIKPEQLMKVVDNWDRITKSINILNHDFKP